MGDRIYTGTGDDGSTSLTGGGRVRKTDARVKAYGAVDEACSAVGLARAVATEPLHGILGFIEQKLYNAAAVLARGDEAGPTLHGDDVAALERAIDTLLPAEPLGGFVLPGGTDLSARLHVARATIRRSEREVLELAEADTVPGCVLVFLNRCSDVLFAAAIAEQRHAHADEMWDPKATPDF